MCVCVCVCASLCFVLVCTCCLCPQLGRPKRLRCSRNFQNKNRHFHHSIDSWSKEEWGKEAADVQPTVVKINLCVTRWTWVVSWGTVGRNWMLHGWTFPSTTMLYLAETEIVCADVNGLHSVSHRFYIKLLFRLLSSVSWHCHTLLTPNLVHSKAQTYERQ